MLGWVNFEVFPKKNLMLPQPQGNHHPLTKRVRLCTRAIPKSVRATMELKYFHTSLIS